MSSNNSSNANHSNSNSNGSNGKLVKVNGTGKFGVYDLASVKGKRQRQHRCCWYTQTV
jgi:hypothetical protein